jgi:dihydrofolate synthase / folylpolyglutamate synthase
MLLGKLGNPQTRYPVIHVAGTKGKGSTCAIIASILSACGKKVGLYTSPHIDSYRERIRINDKDISAADFAALMGSIVSRFKTDGATDEDPIGFRTVFEILTAMALKHFAQEKVDVAVVETGLGGRLDSTNVFEAGTGHPLVCVITPIAYDHVNILGPTISDIAREKAGIIRRDSIVVVAKQPPEWSDEVLRVLGNRIEEVSAAYLPAWEVLDIEKRRYGSSKDNHGRPLQSVGLRFRRLEGHTMAPTAFDMDFIGVDTPLLGPQQAENIRTALAAVKAIERETAAEFAMRNGVRAYRPTLYCDRDAVWDATSFLRLPGRFDIQAMHPPVIVDGSHCPLSAKALADTFNEVFPDREVVLVVGLMRDKQAAEICRAVKGLKIAGAVCCSPDSPRARPAEETAEAAALEWSGVPIGVDPNVETAISKAVQTAGKERAVIVFGSMYLVGPGRHALKKLRTEGLVTF